MRIRSKRNLGARALSLLVVFALLFGTVSSALAFTKNETVAATGLINIRSGPGTSYSVTGKLSKDQQAKFLDASGKWSKIEVNGKVAYAYTKYLKSVGSPSTGGSEKLYATTGVNVRSGPDTSYGKVGTLTKGQQVVKVAVSGKWIKIIYGTGYAYVHGQYLTATEPDNTDDTTNSNNPPSGGTAMTTLYNTSVYAGPGAAYGTLYVVNAGTTVYSTGVVFGDYTQVKTSTGVGYIQTSVLKGSTTPAQGTGTIIVQTSAYMQADYSNGYYLTPLAVGTSVTTTGVVTNGFVQIVYGTGYAYVPQGSIRIGTLNPSVPGGTYQRYTSKNTPVYQSVDTTGTTPSTLLVTLSANTLVTCVSTIGSYTKIAFAFDYGYVLTADLTGGTTGGTLPAYGNNSIKIETAVFAEPRTSSAVLGVAYKGQSVYCTGVVIGDFAQVLTASGGYGYIATNCLTNPVTSTGGAINPVTRTLLNGSNLYSKAYGTSADLLGYANKNVLVTVVSVVGTWSQILFNGYYYYTLSSNLTV